jgi:hypothetical protein
MQLLTDKFTRPANTTAYSAGQLMANSTTAASVVPLKFVFALNNGPQNFLLRKIRLKHTSLQALSVTLYLFNSDPSANSGIANGDGGTFSVNESDCEGVADITTSLAFRDYYKGFGTPRTGQDFGVVVNGNSTVYGLLYVSGSYTPASAETISVTIEAVEI